MGCCGQKRSQAQLAAPPSALRGAGAVPAAEVGHAFARGGGPDLGGPASWAGTRSVALRFNERARILVRGPVTGRSYEFSADQPAQAVEARDAEALLRTRRFVRT